MFQERNEHNLMRDFADEVPGYLNNAIIRETLSALDLRSGFDSHGDNLRHCYDALVKLGVVGRQEIPLLIAWITQVESLIPLTN
jgi:hypothetical protein